MKIYYFNPDELTPQLVADRLGLQLVEDPGTGYQFLYHGKPVGYVVRPGGYHEEKGFQSGAVALLKEVYVSEELLYG